MTGKRSNVLRQYHLLVAREPEGFSWQIRYGRNAAAIERGPRPYPTFALAEADGLQALKRHRGGFQPQGHDEASASIRDGSDDV